MTYAVKEIRLTVQGEGGQVGRAAVFLRFSGCNLWSGRSQDRDKGAASCSGWCDTEFVGTDGPGGGRYATAEALAQAVEEAWTGGPQLRCVVCTGGEPLLQLDGELVQALHNRDFAVAVETNGTKPLPPGIDWVCVSPKAGTTLRVIAGDELKLVFPQVGVDPQSFESHDFRLFLLQPCDGLEREANTRAAFDYCLSHPRWRLSLQTHKYIGVY